jgi:hypothetical protein
MHRSTTRVVSIACGVLFAVGGCSGGDTTPATNVAALKKIDARAMGASWKPRINFDVDSDLMKQDPKKPDGKNHHQFADWVANTSNAFGPAIRMPVPDGKGGKCELLLSPALYSHNIERKQDRSSKAFVAAMIAQDPSGPCPFHGQMIGANDHVLWVVRFDAPNVVVPRVHDSTFGKSWLVHLDMANMGGDDEPVSAESWNLGQCGNSGADGVNDYALDAAADSVCTVVERLHHQPTGVAAAMTATITTMALHAAVARKSGARTTEAQVTPLFDQGMGVSLWFACGTDCCYTDTQGAANSQNKTAPTNR